MASSNNKLRNNNSQEDTKLEQIIDYDKCVVLLK
jgi:hypothetical protein